METHRIALCLRYDGSHYHGWQTQVGLQTIQQTLELAIGRVADHPVKVICAGRTDRGVHASGQVIHFDTWAKRKLHAWVFGINSNLPADISVLWAKPMLPDFHARFSAITRNYRYILYNHSIKPAILKDAVGWYYRPLDEARMQLATQYLLGKHDFSSFRGSGCQARSPVRNIHNITIVRRGRMLIFEILANAYLLHMVRNIVGMLIAIGDGQKSPSWAEQVLKACDRQAGGVTFAPNGLYLVNVRYPMEFNLPETPHGPFFLPEILL